MNIRRVKFENAFNFRDIGGYPTIDKKITRWKRVYRSDSLTELTDNDWKVLKDLNVSRLIDLRSEGEREDFPIKKLSEAEYINISLSKEIVKAQEKAMQAIEKGIALDANFINSTLMNYSKTIFGNLDGTANVMKAVLEGLRMGSLILMCTAGKDRTGMVAALILYLSDVVEEDIIADYSMSFIYNTHGINKSAKFASDGLKAMFKDEDIMKEMLSSKPETMRALLDAFNEKDIRGSLNEHGFTYDMQRELKDLFTF